MIKVINPSVEIWHQEGYSLDDIWNHIARCARVCYQSEKKNKDESEYSFLVRTIFRGIDVLNHPLSDMEILSIHGGVLEHGTVHLKFPMFMPRAAAMFEDVYKNNKYSVYGNNDGYMYVTTNMRVILEHNSVDTLEFIDETPNCPYYLNRITVNFITDIGASRELNRHRVNSICEESTRYCAYDKGKFGNNITVAKLPWIPYKSDEDNTCYENGFFTDGELFYDNTIESQFTNNWNAIDWFLYGLQIANLVYCKTRELGWTAQQAREILPLNTKTQVVHTAFVDDWEHWLQLRSNEISGKVHPSLLELSKRLVELVYPK